MRTASPSPHSRTVVLLHGLGRTVRSMRPLERALAAAGYQVLDLGYPSRSAAVARLAEHIAHRVGLLVPDTEPPPHLVTHSLGGLLVRAATAAG